MVVVSYAANSYSSSVQWGERTEALEREGPGQFEMTYGRTIPSAFALSRRIGTCTNTARRQSILPRYAVEHARRQCRVRTRTPAIEIRSLSTMSSTGR